MSGLVEVEIEEENFFFFLSLRYIKHYCVRLWFALGHVVGWGAVYQKIV